MKIEQRREIIMQYINDKPITTAAELSEKFGVSLETIRKDLIQLEQEGLICRVHGGIAPYKQASMSAHFENRVTANNEAKKRIAKAAASMIQSGDTLFLDGGTTVVELAKALQERKDIIVVTSSLMVSLILAEKGNCRVLATGGWMRPHDYVFFGSSAISAIERLNVDKSFMSGASISFSQGLTENYDEDAQVHRAVIKVSQQSILLVDSTKFENPGLLSVAPVSDFQTLITNASAPANQIQLIRNSGVNVILAE